MQPDGAITQATRKALFPEKNGNKKSKRAKALCRERATRDGVCVRAHKSSYATTVNVTESYEYDKVYLHELLLYGKAFLYIARVCVFWQSMQRRDGFPGIVSDNAFLFSLHESQFPLLIEY